MGLSKTCDFCGNKKATNYFQIFIQDMQRPNKQSDYCICSECLKQHILSNIKTNVDNDIDLTPVPKETTLEQSFRGMNLRNFLRTHYYLDNMDAVFVFKSTTSEEPIIDLHAWMGQPIEHISPKNENDEIWVTLFDTPSDN